MERLVYSPKCYAFVESATHNGKIYNLSDYMVRGEIRRAINAVSTASITIRNPKKIWTGGNNNKNLHTFSPMDKITIFLEKIPGTPLQVFTGFLDESYVYQMYPGTITLTASCTLKRLLYTYWDPALPFVFQFLAQYGWISDGNGNLTNYTALGQGSDTIVSYESNANQLAANANSNITITVTMTPGPPNGSSGEVYVEYGPTTSYGTKTDTVTFTNFNVGVSPLPTFHLKALKANSTYHFRAQVSYVGGGVFQPGPDATINTAGASVPPKFQLNDSSISTILYAVLKDVAGWTEDSIFVESLPTGLPEQLLVLYKDLAENESVVMQQLQQFLTKVIGTGAAGTAGSNASASNPTGTIPNGSTYTTVTWAEAFLKACGFQVTYDNMKAILGWEAAEGGAGPQFGVANNTANFNPLNTTQSEGSGANASSTVNSDGVQSFTSWKQGFQATVTTLFNGHYPNIIAALKAGNNATAVATAIGASKWGTSAALIQSTVASAVPPAGTPSTSKTSNNNTPWGPPHSLLPLQNSSNTTQTKVASRKGGNTNDASAKSGSGYVRPLKNMPTSFNVAGKNSGFGGVDQGVILLSAKIGDPVYSIAPGTFYVGNDGGPSIDSKGNKYGYSFPIIDVSDGPWKGRTIFYGYVQGNDKLTPGKAYPAGTLIGHVIFKGNNQNSGGGMVDIGFYTGDHTSAPYPWIPGQPATPDATTMLTNMTQLVAGDALTPSSPYPQTGTANSQNTPSSQADVESLSVSAAFNTIFNFPSIESTETALLLTGDKSYMNDQSILPFIQQLCQGCLRSFQSMPNGNLFVFFPDYFGAWGKRGPYWSIEDIEILDGSIKINDQALATHVFVSGDTIVANAGTVSPYDQVASTGVVTLTNAGISNFIKRGKPVNNTKNQTVGTAAGSVLGDDAQILSTPQDIINFLQRYGVRPLVQDMPMIHSHYFELFMAYQLFQLMWARQFLTTFTFTFMPELYPGGLVAFPNHGIVMYIDEVYHSWDYEDGFITQANLMAPAALNAEDNIPFTDGLVVQGNFTARNPGL